MTLLLPNHSAELPPLPGTALLHWKDPPQLSYFQAFSILTCCLACSFFSP